MKTIREWLEELPEPYRSQAFRNTPCINTDLYAPSLKYAIVRAFVWHKSPEGFEYWEKLDDTLN